MVNSILHWIWHLSRLYHTFIIHLVAGVNSTYIIPRAIITRLNIFVNQCLLSDSMQHYPDHYKGLLPFYMQLQLLDQTLQVLTYIGNLIPRVMFSVLFMSSLPICEPTPQQ